MSLQDITITASINSIATQSYGQRTYLASSDEQSFPLEKITGSYTSWPTFNKNTNYTVGLVVNVTQSWSGSNTSVLGYIPFTHDTNEEFINGEFSGSNITVSDGNLTDDFCQQFLDASTIITNYSIYPYATTWVDGIEISSLRSEFLNRYTSPRNGELLFHYEDKYYNATATTSSYINYIKIAKYDQEGNNNSVSLESLDKIIWTDSTAGKIILNINWIAEYTDYYLYDVTSKVWTNLPYFADDNILDYTFAATSSMSSLDIGDNYLIYGWTSSIDTANGFNTGSGNYIFPLTPNCEIQFSASMSLTVSTSASFSIAINAYDPANNWVVGSIYAPLRSPSNTYILEPGVTHSFSITSSTYDPIQKYKYEIGAWIEGTGDSSINNAINSTLYVINSVFDQNYSNQYLPVAPFTSGSQANTEWISIVQNGSYSPAAVLTDSLLGWNTYGAVEYSDTTPSQSPPTNGVVLVTDTIHPSGGSILTLLFDGALRPWTNGDLYLLKISIPSSFSSSYNSNSSYGPFLKTLTCSINNVNYIENPTGFIGYIPSQSSGDFYFPVTFNSGETIHIIAPSGSSIFNGSVPPYDDGYFPMISSISLLTDLTASIHNLSFNLTQSQIPQSSSSSVVIEPYLPTNFYYTDCDVLMNNYSQNDISGKVRRVLYDDGSIIPSNIEQIIDRTAEFAEVNDYLYNANANVLPRYAGVRVSQQRLNTWTEGDSNKDKVPSVQNLKTSIAYSNTILDGAPIIMNASKAIVKLLIDETGTALTPNANKYTIYSTQGNFMSGENLILDTLSSENVIISSQYKSIIRGGYKLVPILYNQIGYPGSSIGLSWEDLIRFTDDNPFSSTTRPDLTATLKPNTFYTINQGAPPSGMNMSQIVSKGDNITTELGITNAYTVTSAVINEGFSLKFEAKIYIANSNNRFPSYLGTARVQGSIIRYRNPNYDRYKIYNSNNFIDVPQGTNNSYNYCLTISGVIPSTDLQAGDQFIVGLFTDKPNVAMESYSYFKITTVPLPSPGISSSGLFMVTSSLPTGVPGLPQNYIYTTNSLLTQYFNNSAVHQFSITNSLFDPVTLPFTLQIGDQFRFEGDEFKTFTVKSYTTLDSSSVEINSGSLWIELSSAISGSNTNLDQFLLRRYVPDAQSIIFENLTDKRASGSLLLSPEYKTSLLNNNIDKYIEDLTQKGLI